MKKEKKTVVGHRSYITIIKELSGLLAALVPTQLLYDCNI